MYSQIAVNTTGLVAVENFVPTEVRELFEVVIVV